MKLAEALKKRKVLRETLDRLTNKAATEAYTPEAKPEDTVKALSSVASALSSLSATIAKVNATVTVETKFGVLTLLQARAVRDELARANQNLVKLAGIARQNVVRGGTRWDETTEKNVRIPDTVMPCCIDLDKVNQKANQAARDARDLDSLLQAANWSTEVEGDPDQI